MHISITTLIITYPTTPRKLTCPIVEIKKILPEIMNANENIRVVLKKVLSFSETGSNVRNEDSSDTSDLGIVDKGIDIETPRRSKLHEEPRSMFRNLHFQFNESFSLIELLMLSFMKLFEQNISDPISGDKALNMTN